MNRIRRKGMRGETWTGEGVPATSPPQYDRTGETHVDCGGRVRLSTEWIVREVNGKEYAAPQDFYLCELCGAHMETMWQAGMAEEEINRMIDLDKAK